MFGRPFLTGIAKKPCVLPSLLLYSPTICLRLGHLVAGGNRQAVDKLDDVVVSTKKAATA
jgi:hypothetical protein